jgi:hypothetical protein
MQLGLSEIMVITSTGNRVRETRTLVPAILVMT